MSYDLAKPHPRDFFMPSSQLHPWLQSLIVNRNQQFLLLQCAGWLGHALITYLSLTLWYGSIGPDHFIHTLGQSVLGMLLTTPLRALYSYIWNWPNLNRALMTLLAMAVGAAIWTGLRMIAFVWLSGDEEVWADLGGWYFTDFFIFLCWSALYHGIKYYQLLQREHKIMLEVAAMAREEQLGRTQAESDTRDAQLAMLRYQLNPHFLFNTLNAIYALSSREDQSKAKKMIVQLSQFLRYTLDNDPVQSIPLHKELEALMLYLDIEKTRFGERLKVSIDLQADAEQAVVPSLILQPLIENAIKYAVAPSEDGGELKITAQHLGHELVLQVSDSGPGISSEPQHLEGQSEGGRGVGLRNTRERLQTLYGDAHDFELNNIEPHGLNIVIRIPFECADADSGQAQRAELQH